MKFLFVAFIEFYRICISPFYPPCCRFYPSCSAYAKEAFLNHGIFKGSFFSIIRILRCHPFSDGGYDPVPPLNHREITHGK